MPAIVVSAPVRAFATSTRTGGKARRSTSHQARDNSSSVTTTRRWANVSSRSSSCSRRGERVQVRAFSWQETLQRFGVGQKQQEVGTTSGAEGGDSALSAATSTPPRLESNAVPKAADTLERLTALLGPEDDTAQREEEEADRRRAEQQAAAAKAKEEQDVRAKAFREVVASTMRQQQMQMVFFNMPLFPTLNGVKLPGVEWFTLPIFPEGKARTGASVDEESNGEGAEDSSDRRLPTVVDPLAPGEFSIPIVPYPFVCVPGTQVRLNLFEPRWLTLFSKLLQGKGEKPGVITSATGKMRIDLSRNPMVSQYEDGGDEYDIVPGEDRMDEAPFVDTNSFGAVYRDAQGRIASVGTSMGVVAHDVVVDGRLLSVYAKGERRFTVKRVRQVDPYIVVDAAWVEDEVEDEPAAAGLVGEVGATAQLGALLERLGASDPMYGEVVGVKDMAEKDIKGLDAYGIASVLLYSKPKEALALLASASPAARNRRISEIIAAFDTALAVGLTPRLARLLGIVGTVGSVFMLGVGIAYFRDFVFDTMN